MLVGDLLLEFDGHPVESPEELLDLLLGDRRRHDRSAEGAARRRADRSGDRRRTSLHERPASDDHCP